MAKPTQHKSLWTLLSKLPVFATLQSTHVLTSKLAPIINAHLTKLNPTDASNTDTSNNDRAQPIRSISLNLPSGNEAQSLTKGTHSSGANATASSSTLHIGCANAGVATRLKHTQTSLLQDLNKAISKDAELIKLITADYPNSIITNLKITVSSASAVNQTNDITSRQTISRTTSPDTVELLNSVSQSVQDNELAQSLKSLADTIKKQQDQ